MAAGASEGYGVGAHPGTRRTDKASDAIGRNIRGATGDPETFTFLLRTNVRRMA
jgi:hypothetical protein